MHSFYYVIAIIELLQFPYERFLLKENFLGENSSVVIRGSSLWFLAVLA